jgi:hypothetical protein
MTKDWKKIARASGLTIPDSALDQIAQPLDDLETAFRPLARTLLPAIEPAVVFRADPEDGQ